MQATHYIPDEIERRHGHREEPSLKRHTEFAEEVLGEKRQLTQPQAFHQAHTIFHDLLVFTSDRPWIFLIWSLEIFWLLFVVTACTMEMWGACAFELGQTSYCSYCYSSQFLTFLFVLVGLWFFNLYTYVLLLSRGFQLKLRFLGLTVEWNKDRGIPTNAIYLFMCLSTIMFLWTLVGIVLLVFSQTCLRSGMIFGNRPGRSMLLYGTMVASIILMPILFFAGRCEDAKGFMRRILG
jgi:hypothetical protein